jgi:hypothetical protein
MAITISLNDQILQQLQSAGEVQVEDTRGVPIVLMTVDARQQLGKLAYDDGDWTTDEMRATTAQWLDDPEGWGAPGMEDYDELNSGDQTNHAG